VPFYQPGLIDELTQVPYRGAVRALFSSGVPYMPIEIGDLGRHGGALKVLILPSVGAMSDSECDAVRTYVANGGGLVATGLTSLYDEDGEPRGDFGLADVFGARLAGDVPERRALADADQTTYLSGSEGLIGYGGAAVPLEVNQDRHSPLFVADEQGVETSSPGLVTGTFGRGRVAFLPADIDRRYLRHQEPAHARLLRYLVCWAADDDMPFEVTGSPPVGSYLYRQDDRLILHLQNWTGVDNGSVMTDRLYPTGPLDIRVSVPETCQGRVTFLVAGTTIVAEIAENQLRFRISRLLDHEVLVIE